MGAKVLEGSVFDVLPTVKPRSIDCVVTSPPYWKLRSYLPKDHPLKPLELGGEATPAEFVANLVRVFRLVRTALADHGTVWLNIGDTYKSKGGTTNRAVSGKQLTNTHSQEVVRPYVGDSGNLCLIPQRLAIALQDDGWVVRSVIVWHKPSAMPASLSGWAWRRCRVKVGASTRSKEKKALSTPGRPQGARAEDNGKDFAATAVWTDCPGCPKCSTTDGLVLRRGSWRPTSSWEPILMLAKSEKYYCDGEAVKTPPADATVSRDKYTRVLDDPDEQFAVQHDHETLCSGANLRDVWTINDPVMRLRTDLTPEQRRHVLSRLVAVGL